ncbi:MAG TPA: GNAT family N-acetyltransferase [Paenibacillus sp.]|nr:GNAT family N-acetyltransferase [Paenibacillus sp.]
MLIYALKDRPDNFDDAVQFFWKHWGSERNYSFYRDCMLHSLQADSALPRFYIATENESIIGSYALLRNDLISRQDLFPWLACLYVVPEYRGRRIGATLLEHGLREAWNAGHERLYLCTDLDGYYEKYGWTHESDGYLFTGDKTKIYWASTMLE